MSDDRETITVVIPAYNCEEYIRTAVMSVLDQGEKVRVLLIDDASPSDVRTPVFDLIENGSVEYYRNETNLGVAETRNRGIDLTESDYIAFLDGDDFWLPGKLRDEKRLIKEKNAPLVFTARELYTKDGLSTGKIIPAPGKIGFEELLRSNRIPLGSVLMKSSIAREFHFTRSDLHEDYILMLSVTKKYGEAYGIDEPYLACRQSPDGKSRNKIKSAKMHYKTLRYMGVKRVKATRLMVSYTLAGIKKYVG